MTDDKLEHLGDAADLWKKYKIDGDAEAREELILHYLHLVKNAAGQMAISMPSEVQASDLESYGIFGLIDALDKFDINRGFKFETYAITRIRGAILDGVRNMDWVPASVRKKYKDIEDAYQTLRIRLNRQATDQEVAEYLGLSLEKFYDHLHQISQSSLLYLDENRTEEDEMGIDTLLSSVPDNEASDPFEETSWQVQRDRLAEAIDELTEQERLVITLYYYEGLTLSEIGEVIELSPSRISQIHSKAIMRLRGKLKTEKHLFEKFQNN